MYKETKKICLCCLEPIEQVDLYQPKDNPNNKTKVAEFYHKTCILNILENKKKVRANLEKFTISNNNYECIIDPHGNIVFKVNVDMTLPIEN